jgi:hypothetical protein
MSIDIIAMYICISYMSYICIIYLCNNADIYIYIYIYIADMSTVYATCAPDVLSNKTQEELDKDGNADKYFSILEASCDSKSAKLMEVGLDAIHFLIEHGYLRGTALLEAGQGQGQGGQEGERRTLMDHVIDTVTRCSEEYDEAVHLQVSY